MKLDRDLQLKILKALASKYPEAPFRFPDGFELAKTDEEVVANLWYLAEHKLVTAKFHIEGRSISLNGSTRITAAGMDFLADDGGMSAILGTVTIKFHQDTLRQLIELRLENAQLPEAEKGSLLKTVRELPADSIKHLTTKLLDLGMENLPRAVELIRTALG